MKKRTSLLLTFAITILFFIQLAGTLVESIYILDLMNLELDEKALGLFFFFAPVLVFPLFHTYARPAAWILCAVLLVTRGMLAYLNTSDRLLAAGLGTTAALALLFLLLTTRPGREPASRLGLTGAAGLGLALMLSIALRAAGDGLDASLVPAGGWLGWVSAALLGIAIALLDWNMIPGRAESNAKVTAPVIGVMLLLTLVWFSFSAPSVIARWTQGNYTLIVTTVSLLTAMATFVLIARPHWLARISSRAVLVLNILFTVSLTAALLAQRVTFPPTPDSAPVVVGSPSLISQLTLGLMLLLFPVLFLDMSLFIQRIASSSPRPRGLISGFLAGALILVLLVFINIFSNTWAYVPPVSLWFRGTFWLSFFILAAGSTLLAWRMGEIPPAAERPPSERPGWGWGLLLVVLVIGTAVAAVPAGRVQVEAGNRSSVRVMTYNIQQANDGDGEKSFQRQLDLIRQVSPDLLALQESDSARISLNNNDYVRYFAEQLGYYSYYGPTPVTGTFGTAILSKYPLQNTRTVFTYSDTDEIGTSEAEIEVNGRRIMVYNVHPAGSEIAKMAFARTLLERSQDRPYVVALGDYNLRDDEEAYQLIDSVYTNAWTSVYPTEISPDGVDMSGENRIDHIFFSPALSARNPIYVLPPGSATDHPVHWTEISWAAP